jgi:hypothetical protein
MIGFGIYMAATGLVLAVAPNVLLPLLGLPPTDEPWIRLLGAFMIVVAYYYYRCAIAEQVAFFRATVHGRMAIAIFLLGLAVVLPATVLVLFAAMEVAGALVTARALGSSAGRAAVVESAGRAER